MRLNFWRWIAHYRQGAVPAAFTIFLLSAAAKMFSLVQQMILARRLGASEATDIYFVAQVVPMLVGGILSAALIMTLTREFVGAESAEKPAAWIFLVGLFTAAAAVLWAALGGPVLALLGKGFDPPKLALTRELSRWMAGMLFFYGLSGATQAYHNSRSVFLLPSATYLCPYAGGILGLLFLTPFWGIYGLVAGTFAGLIAQTAMLILPLARHRGRIARLPAAVKDIVRGRLAGVSRSLFYIAVTLFFSQLYFITDRSVSSLLGGGWVSIFWFASSAFGLPLQLIITSVGNAFLPDLSDLVRRERREELSRRIRTLLTSCLTVMVPLTILVFLGGDLIVAVLFKGKSFDARTADLTAGVLRLYSLGMVGYALKDLSIVILLALGREKWSVAVGSAGILLNLVLSRLMLPVWGYRGIAVSTSLCLLLHAAVLIALISKFAGVSFRGYWTRSGWKLAVSSGAMIAGGLLGLRMIPALRLPGGIWGTRILALSLASLAFLAGARLFGLPEMGEMLGRIRRRGNPR